MILAVSEPLVTKHVLKKAVLFNQAAKLISKGTNRIKEPAFTQAMHAKGKISGKNLLVVYIGK